MPAAILAAGVLAGLLAFLPSIGSAQTVVGQLTDASTAEPVEGALVLLLTEEGRQVGGYLTNQAGRFLIQAPGPGTYLLRAERIGYETITSEPFRVSEGEHFGIQLNAAETAIELEGIEVEGDQRCVVRPGEGLQLASVWDEARKALTVQEWTEREGSYRFQVVRYERELDPAGLVVRSETRAVRSGVVGEPIRSLPADDLMANGFVRPLTDGGYEYYGPDASVLLSDEFLDTHCFRLTRDADRFGEIGLSFEPVRRTGIPDIAGTLWLDAATARLRVLEYTYTWAPWEEVRGAGQGRVEFENLPSGAWVVRSWWIRMPLAGRDVAMGVMQRSRGVRLVGIKEVGGGILRFTSLDLAAIPESEAPAGVLEGVVWDSTRQAPLPRATVFLSGTQYATETDTAGTFLLPGLPGGIFQATFTHPRLDSLGIFPQGVAVEITPGEFTDVVLGIPSSAATLESACAPEELARESGVVMGFVRESDGETPVHGATVVVTWSTFEERADGSFLERTHGIQTTSDSSGRYSACGVSTDRTLSVEATAGERTSGAVQAHADRNGVVVVHLTLRG